MVNDAPMEVIKGMRRGAPRSGRYAIRSTMTAIAVEVNIAATRTIRSETAGLDVQSGVTARALAT